MTIFDIDFDRLYRDHWAAAGGQAKPSEEWDDRAAALKQSTGGSDYVREFVRRMDLDGCETLLDVGCGNGAIALEVAARVRQVYGLDYSRGMLQALMEGAAARGLTNVVPIHRAWEDDWADVPVCDVVVASRSTTVPDMADAMAKLDAKARRRVYLTNLVGGRFVDAQIAALLGRNRLPLPDYIYIVNLLYRMGRQPRIDYIENDAHCSDAGGWAEFERKVTFSLGELSKRERSLLRNYFDDDPQRARRSASPFVWAFISWEKGGP